MTVCVAALCKAGEAVVVASDRMITAGPPMNMEFEHERKKIEIIGRKFVTMSSGDALIVTDIIEHVEELLTKCPAADIAAIGDILKNSYSAVRIRCVEEQLLRSINYTFATFQSDGQKQIPLQICVNIIQTIQNFNLNTEFIIAGMTGNRGRIGFVHQPGVLKWYERLGFHAIGSGAIHAVMSLVGHSILSTLEETVFKVYVAKKNAEVAPGVGNLTDMAVINIDGIIEIKPDIFTELDRIHSETKKRDATDIHRLKEMLDAK